MTEHDAWPAFEVPSSHVPRLPRLGFSRGKILSNFQQTKVRVETSKRKRNNIRNECARGEGLEREASSREHDRC
jgi:hypothetical protein